MPKEIRKVKIIIVISLLLTITCFTVLFLMQRQIKLVDQATELIQDDQSIDDILKKIWWVDEPNKDSKTLLIVACENGNSKAVRSLALKGADVNNKNNGYGSPLEVIANHKCVNGNKTAGILLNNGADPNDYKYNPALFAIFDRCKWMTPEELKDAEKTAIVLIQNNAEMIYEGTSVLHEAAKYKMTELFAAALETNQGKYLLQQRDMDGQTPFDISVKHGADDIQRMIREITDKEKAEAEKRHQEEIRQQIQDAKNEAMENVPEPVDPFA